jgi:regulator of sirC expression with transglutaminase-like and TPR domain
MNVGAVISLKRLRRVESRTPSTALRAVPLPRYRGAGSIAAVAASNDSLQGDAMPGDQTSSQKPSGQWNLGKVALGFFGLVLFLLFQRMMPSDGKEDPCTSPSYNGYDRGIALDLYGDPARAAAAYGEYLKDHPDNVEALHNRGRDYDELGQSDNAVADLTRALQFAPKDTWVMMDRARVYQKRGQFDLAMADLNKAVELQPGNWTVWKARGDVSLARGDYAPAIADYTGSLDAGGADKVDLAYFSRGIAYLRSGQFDLARDDFTHYLDGHAGAADATKGRDCAVARSNSGDCALPYPTPSDPFVTRLVERGARELSGCRDPRNGN